MNTSEESKLVERGMGEIRDQYMDAFNRGDLAALAACYTENGRLLPPDIPMVRGRQEIEEFFTDAREMGVRIMILDPLIIEHDGDLAYEVGSYTAGIQPPGDEGPMEDVGKYVFVSKRQVDGSWKIAAHIFNGNEPPAGFAPDEPLPLPP